MNARSVSGRCLAVFLSLQVAHLAAPVAASAQPHVIAPGLPAARLDERAALRKTRVAAVQAFLDTEAARQQARGAGVDMARVRAAVPQLSDVELADLSQRAAGVKDVVAGHGGGEGGLVVLGLVLLVAGIVVLAATVDDEYLYDDYDDCYCY